MSFVLTSCSFIRYSLQDVVEIGYRSTVYVELPGGKCSGFAVDYDIVITAGHCILDQNAIFMYFGDTQLIGEVLIDDDEKDIAIIRTLERIPNIVPLLINDRTLKPGEILTSTGFPFYSGKELTFNTGYFLGYANEELISSTVCFRGNSGGPVMDELGQVVGICSRIAPMIDIYDGFHHSHKDINILVPIKYYKELLK